MNDDGGLTIGQLARRTGVPVRTIRYWSDSGLLPPDGRTIGGYRRYAPAAVARLELIRTLRELGLSLAEVRRVLAHETTLAAVAAVHVRALDAQIRALRLNRAVLSAVAKRQSDTEEMKALNDIARLSAEERRRIIDEFLAEVFGGLNADPHIARRMRHIPELPDDPSTEQVDAWVELAELVQDPEFRRRMRTMAEFNAAGRAASEGPGREPGAYRWFAKKVRHLAAEARERGLAPDSPEAAALVAGVLGEGIDRAAVLERLEAGLSSQADRFRHLVAVIEGRRPEERLTTAEDFSWLASVLRAQA
jgi:DNA-binding transcriptional MerR regulator